MVILLTSKSLFHPQPSILTPLASLPTTPDPSPRPNSPSNSSVHPVTSEEGSRERSRFSFYSTTSSTSGIGSIDNSSQLDIRIGALTPTQFISEPTSTSTPARTRVSFRLDTPPPNERKEMRVGGASVVLREHKKDPSKLKQRMSFTNAFKLLGRKKK